MSAVALHDTLQHPPAAYTECNSVSMHILGNPAVHTSCALALVAPAEALAAWEIV